MRATLRFNLISVFPLNTINELVSSAVYEYLFEKRAFYAFRKGGLYPLFLISTITGKPALYQLRDYCTIVTDYITDQELKQFKKYDIYSVFTHNPDVGQYSYRLGTSEYFFSPLNIHEFDSCPYLAMDLDGVITNDTELTDDSNYPHVFNTLPQLYCPIAPATFITGRWNTWEDRTYTYQWLNRHKIPYRKVYFVGGGFEEGATNKAKILQKLDIKLFIESSREDAIKISSLADVVVVHYPTLTFYYHGKELKEPLELFLPHDLIMFNNFKFTLI